MSSMCWDTNIFCSFTSISLKARFNCLYKSMRLSGNRIVHTGSPLREVVEKRMLRSFGFHSAHSVSALMPDIVDMVLDAGPKVFFEQLIQKVYTKTNNWVFINVMLRCLDEPVLSPQREAHQILLRGEGKAGGLRGTTTHCHRFWSEDQLWFLTDNSETMLFVKGASLKPSICRPTSKQHNICVCHKSTGCIPVTVLMSAWNKYELRHLFRWLIINCMGITHRLPVLVLRNHIPPMDTPSILKTISHT